MTGQITQKHLMGLPATPEVLNTQVALARAKHSNERAEQPRVLCGKASRRAWSQTEITAFPEGLGQCRGLSSPAMRTRFPGRLVPSPQKLSGESGADKGRQQCRATLEMSLPAAPWGHLGHSALGRCPPHWAGALSRARHANPRSLLRGRGTANARRCPEAP